MTRETLLFGSGHAEAARVDPAKLIGNKQEPVDDREREKSDIQTGTSLVASTLTHKENRTKALLDYPFAFSLGSLVSLFSFVGLD